MSSGFKITLAGILIVAGVLFYFLLSPPSNKLTAAEEAQIKANLVPMPTHAAKQAQ
ncbi:MAG: hypothetical protein ACXVBE_10015 [Bdellovibrionota bacterium]